MEWQKVAVKKGGRRRDALALEIESKARVRLQVHCEATRAKSFLSN